MTTAAGSLSPQAARDAPRPLRADARRNRERVLKAARAVFAAQGLDAQIDDVAKRAKVGVGTVYRHFPTKEALLDALVRERFLEFAGYAAEAAEREDAWEGFCDLIWRAAERHASDRAFCETVTRSDQSQVAAECGMAPLIEAVMDRARAQGRLRADATPEDVALMMMGASAVMRTLPSSDAWRRFLTLMLDGLRAS